MKDPRDKLDEIAAREARRREQRKAQVADDVDRLAVTHGPNRAERRARARKGYNVGRSLNTPYRKGEAS